MEDYPRTLEEFEGRFATEQACREYLMQLRWPQGFVCPRCGGRRARPSRRGLLRCGQCDYQASVTAGTIFQDTRLPLRTWFRTMWWVTSQKNGASALGLQSILGLGSYRTAWALLHKLRRAMVRPGRERLSGRVEVDETYVGGAEEGLRGRQTQKKALVAIAAEEDGAGIGRIRMKRIRGASKQPAARLHPRGCRARQHDPHRRLGRVRRPGGAWLSARVRLSGRFEPVGLRAVAPRSPGGCPVEALVDRDAPRRCEP